MLTEKVGRATLYLADCMDLMKDYPDKAFDIAIVDPPYGGVGCNLWKGKNNTRFGGNFDKYNIDKNPLNWDYPPSEEYFNQLFRISKYQVIWGGNYFALPPTRNFLIWYKITIPENFSMAMAEYAWTNFPGNAKVFEYGANGSKSKPRIHPTQKPVELYKWILSLYAKKGDKILDTHMGSGSLEVACIELGFDVVGIEINETYFNGAFERIKTANKQRRLFD